MPTPCGTFGIAVAFLSEVAKGNHIDQRGDADEDEAPPIEVHLAPATEPSDEIGVIDEIVAEFARIVVADASEDEENDAGEEDDSSDDIPC